MIKIQNQFSGPMYSNLDWLLITTFFTLNIADKVTSEWKVTYKECSARDPEAVTDIFKSVVGVFDEVGVRSFEDDESGCHDNERLKPCVIL